MRMSVTSVGSLRRKLQLLEIKPRCCSWIGMDLLWSAENLAGAALVHNAGAKGKKCWALLFAVENLLDMAAGLRKSKRNSTGGSQFSLLVGGATGGGFETLRGDKTYCFISINPKLTITQNLQYTPSLSL